MKQQVLNLTTCYHCGDDITGAKFEFEDKSFCCAGCKGVYQILSNNGMCAYYSFNNAPGKRSESNNRLEYLDEPTIVTRLLDYQDKEKAIVTFYVPAIHCSSCIWLLEHLYKINPAIFNSRIDFLKKQVTVTYKHQEVSLRQVVEIMAQIGYEPSINLQDVVKEHSQSVNKDLILKIAIAGFCMGNVMLFSFPAYFGLGALEKNFQYLFDILNVVISIPVVFYCAKDYFTSAIASLKQGHINLDTPLALIIAVLFLRTILGLVFGQGPGFADTLTGLVFLLLMGKWVKQRTYHHISFERDYRSYFPIAVNVIENGVEKPKAINELAIGDRLWIRNGELIPADAILMKGEGWMDMSFVTGETEPQQKVLGEIIYAGGKQVGEAIEVEVVKEPSQSYLTSLWNKDNYNHKVKQNFNDTVAKYFSIAVFVIAFSSLGYWFFKGDQQKAWNAFTAVIIVACPCVLALSTPFTLSAILAVFDKKGFYIKSTDALEKFAHCDEIIFDKTGTLSSANQAQVNFSGKLTKAEENMVLSLLKQSSHPLSRQITKAVSFTESHPIIGFKEIAGKGVLGKANGVELYAGHPSIFPTNVAIANLFGVHVMIGGVYKGVYVVEQQWRSNLKQLMQSLSKRFKLNVLSGDTARDLSKLKNIFPQNTSFYFEQSPMQKLVAVNNEQEKGKCVMMLGDGLNDAGALKQSDFGIAVTDDVNNFTPGSDAILKGTALHYLPQFFQLSKDGLTIVKLSFAIAIFYNCVGLYFAVQGSLYPLVAAVLMPISTITIIGFTSVATRIFARKNQLL